MKTHRCKLSLAAKSSIRYKIHCGDVGWWLSYFTPDYDISHAWYQSYLTRIVYCPFCGEKL